MSGVESSLVIRSNIYPATPGLPLLDDAAFLASISDPFSLSQLERHRHGRLLNELQRWQSKKGKQCKLADEGDFPWGTKDVTGTGRYEVVCLCKKTSCPLHDKCMERSPDAVRAAIEEKKDGNAPTTTLELDRPLRFGVEDRELTLGVKPTLGTEWTAEETEQLKVLFAEHPREMLYAFFPTKTVEDIEEHIKQVCFARVTMPRGTHALSWANSGQRSREQKTKDEKPGQQIDRRLEKKRVRLENLHSREWTKHEDEIIRENYPRYGSSVVLWSEQLYGRKLADIERRAEFIGVASAPIASPSPKRDEKKRQSDSALKQFDEWEQLLIEKLYCFYGHNWRAWYRLIPWMAPDGLKRRAEELGHEKVWNDKEKAEYLRRRGLDWSVKELNILLEFYPSRTFNASDWLFDLPYKTRAERSRMANLLGVPSNNDMKALISRANKLMQERRKSKRRGRRA